MASVPLVTLNNGVQIPQLGFGTFQIPPAQTKDAALAALGAGYRHIDTAQMYGNELEVGEAVRTSGIPREEVFVTSKLSNAFHAHDDALRAFDNTLRALDIEYLDLFLIHWPMPEVGDYVETWKAMEQMYAGGKVRSIGVSNFQPAYIRRLLDNADIIPAVNQIEAHPYLTQDDVRAYNRDNGIATEAWSPLAKGKVSDDPVIAKIGKRLHKTAAQVTLRWHIQRGDIVFPKSTKPKRMAENLAIFDFELTPDDLAAISALNRDERTGPDPEQNNRIPNS
ncbi:MAG TPA: aldo/keto reductase [Galbitalea sp.]|jgi:2,5-diketo-D-gluconate reductase A|nr:aldo/keto reductase [Galbitalea sp.]